MRATNGIPVGVAFAAAIAGTQTLHAQAPGRSIDIPVQELTLPNGLHVIMAPNSAIPQITFDIWYHVGSKNEVTGRTGFAHMFEHVMFTGSKNVPYGLHDRLTEGVSGIPNNGSTSNDRTNYYEVVPPNYLETILWIESDRMGYLLDKRDSAKFAAQRDIVQNERRQGVDNQPYGRANEITTVALYPESNPYSWPVVGYLSDLQRASVEDVKSFFRTYYAPTNATMAIVGDFDPKQATALVRKYFGDLPKGPAITRPVVKVPVLSAEKRLVYEDRVQLPRLYLRWPTTSVAGADENPLNMLSSILVGSRTARLSKALVYDLQSAANVGAFQNGNESSGDFIVIANPRAGHTLGELETQIDSVIGRLQREGPTPEEMQKARAGLEYGFISGLESNLGKAELLNSSHVFHGDATYYKKQYAALQAVTAADVKRVASKYLGPNRVVLSVVPLGKLDQAAKPERSTRVTVGADGGHYIMGSKQ